MIAPSLCTLQFSEAISDEALMERIAAREPAAITALVERRGRMMKSVIVRVLQDETEADDVLQESILQVWREAKNYSASLGKPASWLLTIARRRAIDRVRHRAAYMRAKDRFEVFVETEPQSWLRGGHTQDNAAMDLRHFLEEELSHLPQFQREVLTLAFFGGMSQREIAAHTQAPLGTVKTRFELGFRKLASSVRAQRDKI